MGKEDAQKTATEQRGALSIGVWVEKDDGQANYGDEYSRYPRGRTDR